MGELVVVVEVVVVGPWYCAGISLLDELVVVVVVVVVGG
jgi:predicted membrane protein